MLWDPRKNPTYKTVLEGDQATICVDEENCFSGGEESEIYQASRAYQEAFQQARQSYQQGLPLPPYKEKGATIPCETEQIIYDGMGRKYLTIYRVFSTAINGTGPIIASNYPENFGVNPSYPAALQARNLGAKGEKLKILSMAKHLEPDRLLTHHADATLGPPVVWEGKAGEYYALGGNGRTIAILRAPQEKYDAYDQEGAKKWGGIWMDSPAPSGFRHILVRVIRNVDGTNLTLPEAIKFAGASQISTSGAETPIRKAISFVRGIGLDTSKLPELEWYGPITADNVRKFQSTNPRFTRKVLDKLDRSQRNRAEGDLAILADLLTQAVAGFLPAGIVAQGLNSPKEEEALLSILPGLLYLQWLIQQREVPEKFALLPYLEQARTYLSQIRKMTFGQALEWTEEELPLIIQHITQQTSLMGTTSHPLKGIEPMSMALGLFIKKAMRAADPGSKADVIKKYIQVGLDQKPTLFGAPEPKDPVVEFAQLALGANLSKKFLAAAEIVYGARENPYRRNPTLIVEEKEKMSPYERLMTAAEPILQQVREATTIAQLEALERQLVELIRGDEGVVSQISSSDQTKLQEKYDRIKRVTLRRIYTADPPVPVKDKDGNITAFVPIGSGEYLIQFSDEVTDHAGRYEVEELWRGKQRIVFYSKDSKTGKPQLLPGGGGLQALIGVTDKGEVFPIVHYVHKSGNYFKFWRQREKWENFHKGTRIYGELKKVFALAGTETASGEDREVEPPPEAVPSQAQVPTKDNDGNVIYRVDSVQMNGSPLVAFSDKVTIEDWPMGRGKRGDAEFSVIAQRGYNQTVQRITTSYEFHHKSQPKKLTGGAYAAIGVAEDGKVYPIIYDGGIGFGIYSGTMTGGSTRIWKDKPGFNELTAVFKVLREKEIAVKIALDKATKAAQEKPAPVPRKKKAFADMTRGQKENKIAAKIHTGYKKGRGKTRMVMLSERPLAAIGRKLRSGGWGTERTMLVELSDNQIDSLYLYFYPAEKPAAPAVEIAPAPPVQTKEAKMLTLNAESLISMAQKVEMTDFVNEIQENPIFAEMVVAAIRKKFFPTTYAKWQKKSAQDLASFAPSIEQAAVERELVQFAAILREAVKKGWKLGDAHPMPEAVGLPKSNPRYRSSRRNFLY